jgi:16S rRNA (cytosine967-C5)-methyltransferase
MIAAQAVQQVMAGRNLTMALPQALLDYPKATPQQKGAATDLSYGTLRHYGQICALLKNLLSKPLNDARIHALLAVALYQLLHDAADAFTVVNQAVHAVGQLKKPAAKPWAKGLVNAVCRNFLRQKDTLLAQIVSDEVATFSYPAWWINKLKQQYGQDWKKILEIGNTHPPMSLRVNFKKISLPDYLKLLAEQAIEATQIGPQAVVLKTPLHVEKIPGFIEGLVSVQDAGAQWAAKLLDVQAGMQVLDACSAPGGKTGHLLELAEINLTALDDDEKRLERVQQNLDRLQKEALCLVGDASQQTWWNGQLFDRILADVPCSASGIVRRHVDIKWLRREKDIEKFAKTQAKILPNLWQMLAKGGKLLYVTCSVFYEENQQQIEQFCQQHADAHCLPLDFEATNFPLQVQGGQLLPSMTHDGFFYALLQKI